MKNLEIDFDRPAKDIPKLKKLFEEEEKLFISWPYVSRNVYNHYYNSYNHFLTKRFLEKQ